MYEMNFLQDLDASGIVTAVASTGSFIAGIAALYTIFEVRKQRESTYKPEVYLDSYTATVSDIPWADSNYPYFNFRKGTMSEEQDLEKVNKAMIMLEYKLHNIGLGPAREVECKWRFDYKKYVDAISKHIPSDFLIYIQDDFINRKKRCVILMYEGDYFKFFYDRELDSPNSVDFILPISVAENRKRSAIPNIITYLLTFYAVFKHKLHEKDKPEDSSMYEDFKGLPMPMVKISYKDINNKRYQKNLRLNFTFMDTMSDDGLLGIYHINVSEM